MKIKIIKYSKMQNTCEYQDEYGHIGWIDPFVGLAIPQSDFDYYSDKGYDLEDRWFVIPNDTPIGEDGRILLPREGEMIEIKN